MTLMPRRCSRQPDWTAVPSAWCWVFLTPWLVHMNREATMFKTRTRTAVVLLLALQMCGRASAGNSSSYASSEAALLDDLTAYIECRPEPGTVQRVHDTVLDFANNHLDNTPPELEKWKVSRVEGTWLHLIELPKPLKAFGHQSRYLTVNIFGFSLVLPERVLKGETERLKLAKVSRSFGMSEEWTKEVSWKNRGNGERQHANLRLTTSESLPGKAMLGCGYVLKRRPSLIKPDYALLEPRFADAKSVLDMLPRLLGCQASIEDRDWLNQYLFSARTAADTPSLRDWVAGKTRTGIDWWDLPKEIEVSGQKVSRLYQWNRNYFVALQGTTPAELAEALGLRAIEDEDRGFIYRSVVASGIAEDGWHVREILNVFELDPGMTTQGCYYEETYPDVLSGG